LKASISHRHPLPTVDIIIELKDGVVLIERRNRPEGWALPGGFVDYGESLESAAIREAKEETGLDIELIRQFHAYSEPTRDQRHHTVTNVFVAKAKGKAGAGDDAKELGVFSRGNLPAQIAFDHRDILNDYFTGRY